MIIYKSYSRQSCCKNKTNKNLAVKIELLKPSTLFSDFLDEITKKYIYI